MERDSVQFYHNRLPHWVTSQEKTFFVFCFI